MSLLIDESSGKIQLGASDQQIIDQPQWSMVVCGDWAPSPDQQKQLRKGPEYLYGDLLPILRETDLAIVNLEAVIDDESANAIPKDGPHLLLPPEVIAGLSEAAIRVACLANNHILDYGVEAMARTKCLLDSHNIRAIGAGVRLEEAEECAEFELKGVRVAIINVAEGEESRASRERPGAAPLDLARVRSRLESLRSRTDIRIVIVHAGCEYLPIPAPHIRSIYRSIVEAGATLVVGHHPHVPQGIEIYHGVPIAYSLGNFVFPTENDPALCSYGYLLRANFRQSALDSISLIPYRIERDRVRLILFDEQRRFFEHLSRLSAIIADDALLLDIWQAYADKWFIKQGLSDLMYSTALLTNPRRGLMAAIQAFLHDINGNSLSHRMMRSGLWRINAVLEAIDRSREGQDRRQRSSRMVRGASILRNRFDTMTHRELYLTALERAMDGRVGQAPEATYQLLTEWESMGSAR